jgi:hypothetical protein
MELSPTVFLSSFKPKRKVAPKNFKLETSWRLSPRSPQP